DQLGPISPPAQSMPQPMPQLVPQSMPQTVPQPVPQPAPQVMPQPMPHSVPQPVPQLVPQSVPQLMPEPAPALPVAATGITNRTDQSPSCSATTHEDTTPSVQVGAKPEIQLNLQTLQAALTAVLSQGLMEPSAKPANAPQFDQPNPA